MAADPANPSPTSRLVSGSVPPGYQRTSGGGLTWVPPSPEVLGRLLPQYEIERLVGCGGMGAVYRGIQRSLDRPVAIKILPAEICEEDPTFVSRFKNEAKVMARLDHPTIVPVYDSGETSEGQLYFVMGYIEGTDVHQMLTTQGALLPEQALAVANQVCDALQYAHAHGVVHRDIKPSNVLIKPDGHVKVTDFGLARVDDPSRTCILTKTGQALGTPDYVAPEVLLKGVNVDGRADLYAVGVMLYQMLTGDVPRGLFLMPSIRSKGIIDPRFDDIITRAMQTDPDTRYQTASEIQRALDAIARSPRAHKDGSPVAPASEVRSQPVPSMPMISEPVRTGSNSQTHETAVPASAPVAAEGASSPRHGIIGRAVWGLAAVLVIGGVWYASKEFHNDKNARSANTAAVIPATPTPTASQASPTTTGADKKNEKASASKPRSTKPPVSTEIDSKSTTVIVDKGTKKKNALISPSEARHAPSKAVAKGTTVPKDEQLLREFWSDRLAIWWKWTSNRSSGLLVMEAEGVSRAEKVGSLGPRFRDGIIRVTAKGAPWGLFLREMKKGESRLGYLISPFNAELGHGELRIQREDGTVDSRPLASQGGFSYADSHTLEARIEGDQITCVLDGKVAATLRDDTHTRAGNGLLLVTPGLLIEKFEFYDLDYRLGETFTPGQVVDLLSSLDLDVDVTGRSGANVSYDGKAIIIEPKETLDKMVLRHRCPVSIRGSEYEFTLRCHIPEEGFATITAPLGGRTLRVEFGNDGSARIQRSGGTEYVDILPPQSSLRNSTPEFKLRIKLGGGEADDEVVATVNDRASQPWHGKLTDHVSGVDRPHADPQLEVNGITKVESFTLRMIQGDARSLRGQKASSRQKN